MPRINPGGSGGGGGSGGQAQDPQAVASAQRRLRGDVALAERRVEIHAPDGTRLGPAPIQIAGPAVVSAAYDPVEDRTVVTVGVAREDLAAVWTRQAVETSIGAVFADVYLAVNASGLEMDVDFSGRGQIKAVINWSKIGVGTQTVRVVQADDEANVLLSLEVASGRNVFPLAALPGWATGVRRLKLQAKSTVGTDSPVFESCALYLR